MSILRRLHSLPTLLCLAAIAMACSLPHQGLAMTIEVDPAIPQEYARELQDQITKQIYDHYSPELVAKTKIKRLVVKAKLYLNDGPKGHSGPEIGGDTTIGLIRVSASNLILSRINYKRDHANYEKALEDFNRTKPIDCSTEPGAPKYFPSCAKYKQDGALNHEKYKAILDHWNKTLEKTLRSGESTFTEAVDHEFFHAVYQVTGKVMPRFGKAFKAAWYKSNPRSFRYLGSGDKFIKAGESESIDSLFEGPFLENAFVSNYAESDFYEDSAETSGFFFFAPETFLERIQSSTALLSKLSLVKSAFTQLCAQNSCQIPREFDKIPDYNFSR